MADLKTMRSKASVEAFLAGIKNDRQRGDARAIVAIMKKATKAEPKMWGSGVIGFGSRTLKYDSGRELDWFVTGLSPRKRNLTLYLGGDGFNRYAPLLEKLGKYKLGKGCLYINTLQDVDVATLTSLVHATVTAKGR